MVREPNNVFLDHIVGHWVDVSPCMCTFYSATTTGIPALSSQIVFLN
jgi:hypothetical protein